MNNHELCWWCMNLMKSIVLVGLLIWFSKQNLAKTLPNTIHTRWNLEREKRGTLEREFVEREGRVDREEERGTATRNLENKRSRPTLISCLYMLLQFISLPKLPLESPKNPNLALTAPAKLVLHQFRFRSSHLAKVST